MSISPYPVVVAC